MSFNNQTRVYGTMAQTIKTWLNGLNARGSTVSSELVQWASEHQRAGYLSDICFSVHVLLF